MFPWWCIGLLFSLVRVPLLLSNLQDIAVRHHTLFLASEKYEDSKLNDVKVFKNYKRTKKAWPHMEGTIFSKFNLEESTDEFYENMNVNFKPWNMEFKTTALT